uniref:Uncharacterized protein n=1 Tax=Cacopsylla melanoneura TaxID=428564 RepID=A0A8D8Q136_9HEMI
MKDAITSVSYERRHYLYRSKLRDTKPVHTCWKNHPTFCWMSSCLFTFVVSDFLSDLSSNFYHPSSQEANCKLKVKSKQCVHYKQNFITSNFLSDPTSVNCTI